MIGLSLLQPNKINIKETSDPDWPHALNLLKTMDQEFSSLAYEMELLYNESLTFSIANNQQRYKNENNIRKNARDKKKKKKSIVFLNEQAILLLNEFHHCFDMLSLRAKQVYALYLSFDSPTSNEKAQLQKISRQYINHGNN